MPLRLLLSYLFFYARFALVALIALPARLLLLLLPRKSRIDAEAGLIRLANKLFRRIVPVEPYLDRDAYYEFLDTHDFRTLCRRLGLPDDWYHGLRILDVGCGHGKLSRKLAQEGAMKVEGIDIAGESIAYANKLQTRESVANLRLRVQSVYTLDFPDNYFDAAISQVVFEHIDDIPRALSEIHRVLKPGGRFYFTIDAFRSRYGAHMAHFVLVPWPLVLFSEPACEKVWCDSLVDIQKKNPSLAIPDFFQWCMSLPCLNRVRLRDLERMISQAGFKTQGIYPFADEKPLLKMFPWKTVIPDVYEYLRGSAAYLLQK